MVAVIKTGSSLHRIFNYNENKVKEGVAECLSAVNYPKDVEDLSVSNKLNRLLKQAELNENVTRNSVHISLNFDPSESISDERLGEIADLYMQKIGFGNQPYLVYKHMDAGHPHLHIVTVKVRADGSRIDMNNLGRNQSEKARKEIEELFGLVRAEDSKHKQGFELKPVNVQKVLYGRSETKRAITNILDAVVKNYKYTSLPELNAVLQLYNVTAERGGENSRVFKHDGLYYRIVDEDGKKVGVPVKASDIYNKPTLPYLQTLFSANEAARQPYKGRVKNAVDLILLKQQGVSLQGLMKSLEKEGISTILRQNSDGVIYGITYIDHRTKCVFNGSDLGKQYSARMIVERCGTTPPLSQPALHTSEKNQSFGNGNQNSDSKKFDKKSKVQRSVLNPQQQAQLPLSPTGPADIIADLIQPEQTFDDIPGQFKKKSKKKRKKNNNRL